MHRDDISIPNTPGQTPAVQSSAGSSGTRATDRRRLPVLVGGVIAVGALTFGIGAAFAQASAGHGDPAVGDHPAIAEMARLEGLSGLSPASLTPTPVSSWYGDSAAIAEMARLEGLSGLSPASLAPRVSSWYGDSAAIAEWARSNGLTGLSPASLAPAED